MTATNCPHPGPAVPAGPGAAVSGSPDPRLAQAATGLPLSVVNEPRHPTLTVL